MGGGNIGVVGNGGWGGDMGSGGEMRRVSSVRNGERGRDMGYRVKGVREVSDNE